MTNFRLGQAYFALGEYRRAMDVFRRNVEMLEGELVREGFGMPGLPAVTCRAYMAWCLACLGDFSAGSTTVEEGVRVARTADHKFSLLYARLGLRAALMQGNLTEVIPGLEHSLDLCKTGNITVLLPWFAWLLGDAYVLSGRVAEGLKLLEPAAEQSAAMELMGLHPGSVSHLSKAYLSAGRPAEAMQSIQRALHLCRDQGQRGVEAESLQVLGEIHASKDPPDVEQAEAAYHRSARLATDLGIRPLVAHCQLGLGKLYLRTAKREQGDEHLTTAATMYREMDMRFWLEKAEADLAELR